MNLPSVTLVLVVGVLFAIGFHQLLQRSLIRIVIGFAVLGHAANLALLLAGGPAAAPPLLGGGRTAPMADPLPQAMALTAIVITFGVTAFLLALAFCAHMLTGDDEVRDDIEDRRVGAEGDRAGGIENGAEDAG